MAKKVIDDKGMSDVHDAIRSANEADEIIRKAVACGYDCSVQQAMVDSLKARLEAIKREFGGGMRT